MREFMKKKVLLSIFLVACIGLFLGAGVYSLFQDVETTTGNTFAAGTLDLQVGTNNPTTEQIAISALKPNDSGTAANWQLQNLGTISGDLNISVSTITNNENTRLDLETAAGDTTDGATEGEMGANLNVAFWVDITNDGWSSGDYYLQSDGTQVAWASGSTLPSGAYDPLDNYAGRTWANVQTDLGLGTIGYFRSDYELPLATTNVVQSDSSVFNITFTLTQH
jgi:predicted ribosomally synthesized peptide with SipW-like signal peptide